jgi:hypothetical protein
MDEVDKIILLQLRQLGTEGVDELESLAGTVLEETWTKKKKRKDERRKEEKREKRQRERERRRMESKHRERRERERVYREERVPRREREKRESFKLKNALFFFFPFFLRC